MLEEGRDLIYSIFPSLENLSQRDHHEHNDLNDAPSCKLRPETSIIHYIHASVLSTELCKIESLQRLSTTNCKILQIMQLVVNLSLNHTSKSNIPYFRAQARINDF